MSCVRDADDTHPTVWVGTSTRAIAGHCLDDRGIDTTVGNPEWLMVLRPNLDPGADSFWGYFK
jgi:hypothetical protein